MMGIFGMLTAQPLKVHAAIFVDVQKQMLQSCRHRAPGTHSSDDSNGEEEDDDEGGGGVVVVWVVVGSNRACTANDWMFSLAPSQLNSVQLAPLPLALHVHVLHSYLNTLLGVQTKSSSFGLALGVKFRHNFLVHSQWRPFGEHLHRLHT